MSATPVAKFAAVNLSIYEITTKQNKITLLIGANLLEVNLSVYQKKKNLITRLVNFLFLEFCIISSKANA